MKKYLIILLISFISLIGLSHQKDSIIHVTENLYMISGDGGNVSFLVTEDGVLVVDSGLPKLDGKNIEELIASVTDEKIKYLIFTHYHYDHTFGAVGLSDDIVIISHDNFIKT